MTIQVDGVVINPAYITVVSAVCNFHFFRDMPEGGSHRVTQWVFAIAVHDAAHGNPPLSPVRVVRDTEEEANTVRNAVVRSMSPMKADIS